MTAATSLPEPSLEQEKRAAKEALIKARAAMLRAARIDGAAFNAYVLRDEETGKAIELADMHVEWHDLIERHPRFLLWSHVEAGKMLPLSTAVPRPDGSWSTMGDLAAGDRVIASDGQACTVLAVSDVENNPTSYRITFDDGTAINACADHQWVAKSIDDEHARRLRGSHVETCHPVIDGVTCACGCGGAVADGKRFVHNHHRRHPRSPEGWRVVTTAQMLRAGVLRKSGAKRPDGTRYPQAVWRMPLPKAVTFPDRELPLDPYVLGVWLGDGTAKSNRITFHIDDVFVFDECDRILGGKGHHFGDGRADHVRTGVLGPATSRRSDDGLRSALRRLGVLDDKHVPEAYLTASRAQRLALLQGLLDTDGTVTVKGAAQFANTNGRLARAALELARSLGFKAHITTKTVKVRGPKEVGTCWTVSFMASEHVFRLPRKRAKQSLIVHGRASYRSVVAIEPVAAEPMRCISVDSRDSTYLVTRDYLVTHNTSSVSIGRTLFELGKDTSKRIVILSKTQGQSVKIIRSIATYIERSPELREVFPNLFPSVPWTSTSLMVQREVFSKDFSVQACGVGGVIVGARIDILIIDDILDWKNTRTPAQRAELLRWFRSEFIGRLTADSRVIVCGNAYHPEDFLHTLAREGYEWRRYPVEVNGVSSFPRKWTPKRIAAKKIELGPVESARQLYCVARKDSDSRCKEEWVRACLRRGAGVPLFYDLPETAFVNGGRTYTGVDIGVGKTKRDAKTVVFTIYLWPNGDVQVIGLNSGRWSGLEIVETVVRHHLRYKSMVYVESNGAQMHLLDFAHDVLIDGVKVVTSELCVLPFNTGSNKTHPVLGVEGIFAEFQMERWIIPSIVVEGNEIPRAATEEISEWLSECENYDPTRHTGDHLMAAWIARKGSRAGGAEPPQVGATVIGASGGETAVPQETREAMAGWENALIPR